MPLHPQSLLDLPAQLVLFLIILNHSLLIALGLKFGCQARALFTPVSLVTKMSAPKLIHYFSSHPAAFRFQSCTPPDNITLTSANRKADQNLSDFQTGVGATAYATIDTEQHISYLRFALGDTLSLPDLEGSIIPVSEVCELLLKVHEILDNVVSK